jgi:hypothetical protein
MQIDVETPFQAENPGVHTSRFNRPTPRGTGFVVDSALEGTGFEPSVPLLRRALLGVANRRRRHERRSHLQVQVRNGNACLEWLPTAFPLAETGVTHVSGTICHLCLGPLTVLTVPSGSRSLAAPVDGPDG